MGTENSDGRRPRRLVLASRVSALIVAFVSCAGCASGAARTPLTRPEAGALGAFTSAHAHRGNGTAAASVVPRRVHGAPIALEVLDADARIAVAISRDGHVSMRDLASGAVRASFVSSEVTTNLDAATAFLRVAANGRRALVGTRGVGLGADDDSGAGVNHLVLWDLVGDHRVTLVEGGRGRAALSPPITAVHADPDLMSVFVVEGATAGSMRVRAFDPHGTARCVSDAFASREPESAIVALDGSAIFFARVGDAPAVRLDAVDCGFEELVDVERVLATSPNGSQMVTRDVDGTDSLRSPRDGARFAAVPGGEANERYTYDASGACLAMVDSTRHLRVLRVGDLSLTLVGARERGEFVGIEPGCGAVVLARDAALVRLDLADGTERLIARPEVARVDVPTGASEQWVDAAFHVPSRSSIVVVTASAVVEWTSSGPRVTACGGGSRPVFGPDDEVRLVNERGYCDLAHDRWVERPVYATSDDGAFALVGRARAETDPHAARASLLDLRDGSIRGTLPDAPLGAPVGNAASGAAWFTSDGATIVVAPEQGPLEFYATRSLRLRGRYRAPEGRRVEVRGRTADGLGLVIAVVDPGAGPPDLLRIETHHPSEVRPHDASAPVLTPPATVPGRSAPVECRDGVLTLGFPDASESLALGDCVLVATCGIGATGSISRDGRLAIVTDEETTHVIGVHGEGHVILRASFEVGVSGASAVVPFAIDTAGHAWVDAARRDDVRVRRAGDARTAALDPAPSGWELLATLGRLLPSRPVTPAR